jgi:hypothetical protein
MTESAKPNPAVRVGDVTFANDRPIAVLAGPCQMESRAHALEMASALKEICARLGIGLVYKTSFDKANRSSGSAPRGIGLAQALPIFAEIRASLGLPVLTDVHESAQCAEVAQAVDVLQIPAFLCRQTDLLLAAAPSPGLSIETNYISGGNGNGIVDPNECNDLYLVLRNHAGVTATGVSGTLSSTTPGVIIAQRTSPYLDIPQGATGTNLVAFKISTSPSFVCGTPIDLILLIKTDQKISVAQLRLQTGAPGVPLRFDNNISVPIPDNDTVESSIIVSGLTGLIGNVSASVYITHTFDLMHPLEW